MSSTRVSSWSSTYGATYFGLTLASWVAMDSPRGQSRVSCCTSSCLATCLSSTFLNWHCKAPRALGDVQ
eukprot:8804082-Lingulodinium_polyedra.AAC.1